MKQLLPLVYSHEANDIEHELKQLTIRLYQKHLASRSADINNYGMPHLGSKELLKRYLVSQGISNFNLSSLTEDEARYLLLAWRYRNPKRGTHFLHTFIKCVWGSDFEIAPLWQKKKGTYPQDTKTLHDIENDRENINDYFLTSRLKIVLYGTSGHFSTEIAKSLNKILPARLFVTEVGRDIAAESTIYLVPAMRIHSVLNSKITEIIEECEFDGGGIYYAAETRITSVLYGSCIT